MKQGRNVHGIPLLDAFSDHNITSRMCGHILGGTLYYIMSVGGMVIVCCTEYRGCPLLGGLLSINVMLNSIRVIEFVRYTQVVRFSECPLWEVPL